jgi:hypothetical protein
MTLKAGIGEDRADISIELHAALAKCGRADNHGDPQCAEAKGCAEFQHHETSVVILWMVCF